MEKTIEQPQVPVPEISRMHDKIIPDYAIPYTRSRVDSVSRMVNRKSIQDINREIPTYLDPTYNPLLNW